MMNYFEIAMSGFDKSAEAQVRLYGGHIIDKGRYILDTNESARDIERNLRQTADVVTIKSDHPKRIRIAKQRAPRVLRPKY